MLQNYFRIITIKKGYDFSKGVRGSSNYPDWNNTMNIFPKILKVIPLADKKLSVLFDNGKTKTYDCKQLLKKPAFSLLKEEPFFKSVKVEVGGYGISWNDNVDISEYELWTNGMEIDLVEHTPV